MASKKIFLKQYANEVEGKRPSEYQSLQKEHQHVGSRKVKNTRSFENLYSEGQRSSRTRNSGPSFLQATNSGREHQGLLLSNQPISASRSYDDLYSKGQRANKLGHGSSSSVDSEGEYQTQDTVRPIRIRHPKSCDALFQQGQRSQRTFSYGHGQRSEIVSNEQEHQEKSRHLNSTSFRPYNTEQKTQLNCAPVNPSVRHHRSCDELVSKGQRLSTKIDHIAASEGKLNQDRLKPPKAYSSPSLKPCRSYEDMYSKDGSQKRGDSPLLKPFRSSENMHSKDGGQKGDDHLTAVGKIVRDNLYPLRVAHLKHLENNDRIRPYKSCEDIRRGDRVLAYPRLPNKLSEMEDGKKPSDRSSSKSNSEGALSKKGADSSYGSLEDHLQSNSEFSDLHNEIGTQIRKRFKGAVLENVSSSMPELHQVESNVCETWVVPSMDDVSLGGYGSTSNHDVSDVQMKSVSLDNLREDNIVSLVQEKISSGLEEGCPLVNQRKEHYVKETAEKIELKSRNNSSSGQENVSSPDEIADRGTVPLEEDLKQLTTVTSRPSRKLTIITIEHAQTEDLHNGDCITNYMNDAVGGNSCKDGDGSPR